MLTLFFYFESSSSICLSWLAAASSRLWTTRNTTTTCAGSTTIYPTSKNISLNSWTSQTSKEKNSGRNTQLPKAVERIQTSVLIFLNLFSTRRFYDVRLSCFSRSWLRQVGSCTTFSSWWLFVCNCKKTRTMCRSALSGQKVKLPRTALPSFAKCIFLYDDRRHKSDMFQ